MSCSFRSSTKVFTLGVTSNDNLSLAELEHGPVLLRSGVASTVTKTAKLRLKDSAETIQFQVRRGPRPSTITLEYQILLGRNREGEAGVRLLPI